jgi:hypothetical protein
MHACRVLLDTYSNKVRIHAIRTSVALKPELVLRVLQDLYSITNLRAAKFVLPAAVH